MYESEQDYNASMQAGYEAEMQAQIEREYQDHLEILFESEQYYLWALEVVHDLLNSSKFKQSGLSVNEFLSQEKKALTYNGIDTLSDDDIF